MKLGMKIYQAVGLMILSGIVMTYGLLDNPKDISVKYINGKLISGIKIISHGGEMEYEYLVLKIDGIKKEFRFNGCAFTQINIEKLKSEIVKGDDLRIGWLKEFNDYYDCVFLEEAGLEFVALENYESCINKKGRLWEVLFGVSIVYFLVQLYWSIKAKNK